MDAPNRTYVGPVLLADELVRAGVRHACITPGSRSTPLALTLAAHPALRAWSHIDERSAGFFALGLAKATRSPVVLACTSGTAAANFLPAVIEAWHAHVPLVVLTADRPPELRDCGAGQTIDQVHLFGSHVRWFVDVGTPEPTAAWMRWARTLACRAVATAVGPPAGPVHLNCAFRDPLVPDTSEPIALVPARNGSAWVQVLAPDAATDVAVIAPVLRRARRPIIVCGLLDDPDPALPGAVAALAQAIGAPVLAEPASNLRRHPLDDVLVDAHDAVLRHAGFAAGHLPDVVVRLGAPPTSKVLGGWLAQLADVPQIVVAPDGSWPDPASVASQVVRGAPLAICTQLARALDDVEPDPHWRARWRRAARSARHALATAVAADGEPFEAHAIAALAATLPSDATLYVGNSLAIRDLDWFWPAHAPTVRVLANRGANGIDGFVSSVLGAAAASPIPTVGLCGDLSLYHDLNGLLAVRRHGVRAVLLVVDNDGGGIFDHLPVAREGAHFEEFFATPHGLDFRPAVEMYGAGFERVTRVADLGGALERALAAPRTTVVLLQIDRAHSVAAHTRAWRDAERAVGEHA
ncbi:MAG TPA: 2-succinyl-5-enolpyruvyl-6-hydroxy-3-cyclohexene-1-carboxylic-acid synthase [Candidatus Binatia bacterium]|jgi:2-succinyl-5-enolpyruvyl-6-hydroxy-3-cyclohexene-1-carboxylate synthase|nr:2-succinyl-5-enolpyruvyl-6-hydroxy-3-cyclohexene-1-carboxylic-acid synthase [Candidatus Binatia bacterium]